MSSDGCARLTFEGGWEKDEDGVQTVLVWENWRAGEERASSGQRMSQSSIATTHKNSLLTQAHCKGSWSERQQEAGQF